jgi:hypothetical protein
MFALALVASCVLTAGLPIPPQALVPPEQSFRAVTGFRVRVDVHAQGRFAARLGEGLQQQIERTLRHEGIQVVPAESARPVLDGLGLLVLDLHVLEAEDGAAVAWSLHGSQFVHLPTGAFVFASTWEVGDLLHAPREAAMARLRDSVQPAVDEFCRAYLASRAAPPAEPPEPSPSGAPL